MAYIYKITNLLNGKIYVGKRVREDTSDMEKYYGSGIAIKLAIQKYGKENFKKNVFGLQNLTHKILKLAIIFHLAVMVVAHQPLLKKVQRPDDNMAIDVVKKQKRN